MNPNYYTFLSNNLGLFHFTGEYDYKFILIFPFVTKPSPKNVFFISVFFKNLLTFFTDEYINKQKAEGKEEISYIGTKLSELEDDEVIKKLKEDEIIKGEECEKYYKFSDEDLLTLNAGFGNEENSFYIVNYETGEVIFSSGLQYEKGKILYKLSDIEKLNEEN